MSIGERFFARIYDRFTARSERACFATHRQALAESLHGDVIEIGGGTGANLPYYGDRTRTLTVTEPSLAMIRRLERRLGALELDARVVKAPAEALPFADDSFDVAVSTLVLCSVDDPPQALRELRRVLRPGGQLLFMEHVRSEEPRLARLQDRMNRLNNIVAHCDCNRPTLVAMQGAGFSIRTVEHGTIAKAPPFVRPLVVGVADA